jgi:predicted nucleic acid-binding protein
MSPVYVDASVILRIVLDEPGQLPEWGDFEEPLTSALAEVEGLRTIDRAARRSTHPRRKPLTVQQANTARTLLYETLEMFTRVELVPAILTRAGQLAGPLGTLDALHLATVLAWKDRLGVSPVLATHDPDLAAVAAAHGLTVIGAPVR